MEDDKRNDIRGVLDSNTEVLSENWLEEIGRNEIIRESVLSGKDLNKICEQLTAVLISLVDRHNTEQLYSSDEFADARRTLQDITRQMVSRGMSPVEATVLVFSLKKVVISFLRGEYAGLPEILNREVLKISDLTDNIGLLTFDIFVRERELIIRQQQQDMVELSTPVIRVWDGILSIPLIGTLDSKRTQLIMERLLEMIVETGATVAIIDITGIPTVDTLVANHLIKTARAVKLLGAELIITGIRPVVAQTMVHLGIDLSDIITKSLMADGVKLAFEMQNYKVVKVIK